MTQSKDTVENPQPISLTTNDIKALLSVIDIASQRGAFKTSEYVEVGTIYKRVAEFVAHADYHDKQERARAQQEQPNVESKTAKDE